MPIKAVQRGTDKLTRFMNVQSILEVGKVWPPKRASWLNEFIIECEAFRADMAHDHDDQVDTLIDFLEFGARPPQTYATAGKRKY